MLEQTDRKTTKCEAGGELLPLSVCQSRSFDVVAIETLSVASDERQHPVLGLTLRVRIDRLGESEEQITSRNKRLRNGSVDARFSAVTPPSRTYVNTAASSGSREMPQFAFSDSSSMNDMRRLAKQSAAAATQRTKKYADLTVAANDAGTAVATWASSRTDRVSG